MYTQHVHMILNGAAALVHIERERERERGDTACETSDCIKHGTL